MNRTGIAKFEKVSWEQFLTAWKDQVPNINEKYVRELYDHIQLPKRATAGSAGYDFYMPEACSINHGQTVKVPTGIRCNMDPNWVLMCFPRSGLGFKYRLQLDNTVGIIDSDYYHSDNEGHIFIKITNDTYDMNKSLYLEAGQGFAQGIFVPYGITVDDNSTAIRNGGFGSTDKKEG